MKLAGVSAASRSTRLAAGCTRCWSAKKSSRPPVITTISPSTVQRSRQLRAERGDQVGEVARHRLAVAAVDLDRVAVA